jgi:two-component system cell cycle response regulator
MSDDTTMIKRVEDLLATPGRRSAYVIILSGQAVGGRMFKLTGPECILGRGDGVDIRVEDEGVSRRHAKLTRDEDGNVRIVDLGSTNGTFVNGRRVDARPLSDGDRIQIGSLTTLQFAWKDELEEQLQLELYEQATRDPLTRIYNKRLFEDRLEEEFAYCLRHRVPLSLVMFDLDFFKRVNDTLGHPAGDHVLQALAARVSDTIRTEDLFCRYGGEEFAVIMRESTENQAVIFAERLRRLVEAEPFVWNDTRIPLTISLGVATLRDGNFRVPAELVAAADRYLFRAKGTRNRVEAALISGL